MKKALIPLLMAAFVALPIAESFADETYYIELGGDVAKADIDKDWQALVAKHKKLLGQLKLYPKAVIADGKEIATRMQAGPITSKNKAQKLCSALFTQRVPCFVIEGVGNAPPSTMIALGEKETEPSKPFTLPWFSAEKTVAAEQEETAAPAVEETAPAAAPEKPAEKQEKLPWLVNKNVPGEVDVAEAIRVPLSDEQLPQGAPVPVTVKTLDPPVVSHTATKATARSSVGSSRDNESGWLNVDAFASENSATEFWQQVRAAVPEKAAGLRVRVVRPMLTRNDTQATLNVGPFPSRSDAFAFCEEGIQAVDKSLRCHFDTSESQGILASAMTRFQHGEAYNARREAVSAQRGAVLAKAQSARNQLPAKVYWVQVLTAASQLEALHDWDDLKTANPDILDNKRSSVSASLADKTHYVVRVGPMGKEDEAVGLCAALKDRGVDCHVLLYSTM